MRKAEQRMTLDHWQFIPRPFAFGRVLADSLCITGIVAGSSRFKDGERIHTSVVRRFDRKRMTVKTANGSLYHLLRTAPIADEVLLEERLRTWKEQRANRNASRDYDEVAQ